MKVYKGEQPAPEELVSITGTGKYKGLAKGVVHQVPQAEADALVESGRATLSKKSEVPKTVPAGERDREAEISPDDVDQDAKEKAETDAVAEKNVNAGPQTKQARTKTGKAAPAKKTASKK